MAVDEDIHKLTHWRARLCSANLVPRHIDEGALAGVYQRLRRSLSVYGILDRNSRVGDGGPTRVKVLANRVK